MTGPGQAWHGRLEPPQNYRDKVAGVRREVATRLGVDLSEVDVIVTEHEQGRDIRAYWLPR